MKVLVTGVSGFMGRHFIEQVSSDVEVVGIYNSSDSIVDFVKEKGLENVSLHQCDLTDEESVKKLFSIIGSDFDHCMYLAGNINVPLSKEHPDKDLAANAMAMIYFLKHVGSIKRFVYLGTAGIYDGNSGKVTTESSLHPVNPYCISKMATEAYVKYYQEIGTVGSYVLLRFGGAFGTYSDHKFMSKLVKDVSSSKEEIEIYGDGSNIINVMYAPDAIKALLVALKSDKENVVANLGLENMSIDESVTRTAKALGKDISIKHIDALKEQKYIHFEIDMDFNSIFDFSPDHSFEEGIKKFSSQIQ